MFCINSTPQYIDFKDLYEQQLQVNTAQQNTVDEQSQRIILLELQILELRKFIFGGKQEKFTTGLNTNAQQIALFGQDKLGEVVVESIRHVKAHEVKQTAIRVNHPGRKPLSADLRREEIRLMPTEDVIGLSPVGEEITELLEYRQGELYVKKYIRPEYIKPTEDGTQARRIIAAVPNMPISKSFVGASLLAHMMASKYVDHLPVYRQLQMFTRQKIVIEDNTVNNWFRQGCALLDPLYQAHERQVLQTKYLCVDETPTKVLDKTKKGTTHQGYYWVYYNTQSRQVLFKYHTGRAVVCPKKTLGNYQGYLQTDGYAAYNQFDEVPGIVTLNCWAHARRKFIDAQSFDTVKAGEVLAQIQLLYAAEKYCAENSYAPDQVKDHRAQHALPVLNNLHELLKSQLINSLPKSPLGMALQYTLARWDKLIVYLQDGNLRIDNNLVENSIRPVAIGRKNYLFAGNHEAAERSAMLYSLFATCKLHNVNPIE